MNHRVLIKVLGLLFTASLADAWASSPAAATPSWNQKPGRLHRALSMAVGESSSGGSTSSSAFQPVFDFSTADAVDKFERIDDAIMGGISTSQLVDVKEEPYAKWFGVCRTDGGGFCGMRTLPFKDSLVVGDANGLYLECRLASDDEPERREWKMTTRIESSRGETLYQAPFSFESKGEEWTRIRVPFETFRLVRGPRMIPDAPPLNTTGGLFQVGMTMSKFAFGEDLAEIKDFRAGFFELQVKAIGLYKEEAVAAVAVGSFESPKTLSKEEAQKKRPLILKLLFPIAKLFFSEQSQRRKSAMKILRNRRKMSRASAIWFGFKSRARSYGAVRSLAKTFAILVTDSFRGTALLSLRIAFIYPFKIVKSILSVFRSKPKASSDGVSE